MAPPSPARVCVRDLVKRYGDVTALRGVNFEARPAQIFGLLGPNGAGKTTTLECLLGLRFADQGSVSIDGMDPRRDLVGFRRRVGAQLQSAALQDKITPREAIRLFAAFYPNAVPETALLDRFGLTEKASAPFDSLSAGQRQRLFLALAFVNQPSVVVLDEPTTGLDPKSRRELHRYIREAKDQNVTVILSTHYLEEAASLCDRLGILHQGRIIAEGTPAELIGRSSAKPSVRLQTRVPLTLAEILAVPGVSSARLQGECWLVDSTNAASTLADLALRFRDREIEMLSVQRPSLEDVFLELTGTTWSEEPLSKGAEAD